MRLDEIGFYTLSDARAAQASEHSPLWRCEMILTDRCNFACPYCRKCGVEMSLDQAFLALGLWILDGLKNVRFSGGEPTLYRGLARLVAHARDGGVARIALSTNGSARWEDYLRLLDAGVNDFSISLDACCASTASIMAGGLDLFDTVVGNIRALARRTYTTVGVVLTEENAHEVSEIIEVAHSLGVADIRLIPAAQSGNPLFQIHVRAKVLDAHPVLRYRVGRALAGLPIRGLEPQDADLRCGLVLDDVLVSGRQHYPCVIYFREGGAPIGAVNSRMRADRAWWHKTHWPWNDPICRTQCLDVCVAYNRAHAKGAA